MTRPWRWVTRDKGTHYGDTVSIWPGTERPFSRIWSGTKWLGPTESGVFDYHQESKGGRHNESSIDLDVREFDRMFGVAVRRGETLRIDFHVTDGEVTRLGK